MGQYNPPKFELNIESSDHFTLRDEKITVNIDAKYACGKNVRGKATISFNKINYPSEKFSIEKIIDIDGRQNVEIDIPRELHGDSSSSIDDFKMSVNVVVVEELTGLIRINYFQV